MDNLTSKQRKEIAKSNVRYLHVSQYLYVADYTDQDTGVVSKRTFAAFTDSRGLPCGKPYVIGRNAFKRMCRRNGLNRVQLERRAEQQQAA